MGGKLWDSESGTLLETLEGPSSAIYSLAWSPDGTKLAAAGDDQTVHVWDAANAVQLAVLTGHNGAVGGVVWSPDGNRLASASNDATVRVWDARTYQLLGLMQMLRNGQWLTVSPEEGHYRGSPRVERQIVYVVQTDDGRQETLTPEEFAANYGWKNDPARVRL